MDENPYQAPQASDSLPINCQSLAQRIAKTGILTYLALCVGVGLWVCLLYLGFGMWR
jgi:hypothetical protein